MKKLIMVLLLTSCAYNPVMRTPSKVQAKDFQDEKIAERINSAITPQIGI